MEHPLAFQTGHLINPNKIKKESPFLVLWGHLFTTPGTPSIPVYVKLLPAMERSVEAVCAWIGQELGLPAPVPYFVRVRKSIFPTNRPWPFDENEILCFGTAQVHGALELSRLDSDLVSHKLLKWPHLVSVAIFDHLIANDDRSGANLLFDGQSRFWILDNGQAFGGSRRIQIFDDPFPVFKNSLLDRLSALPLAERNRKRSEFLTAIDRTAEVVERIPYSALGVENSVASKFDSILRKRARVLHAMIFSAVGFPELFDHESLPNSRKMQ
jgi:hypothetical protein